MSPGVRKSERPKENGPDEIVSRTFGLPVFRTILPLNAQRSTELFFCFDASPELADRAQVFINIICHGRMTCSFYFNKR